MSYIALTGFLDTNIRVKPETQNVRKLVDATGSNVSAPTAFASTRVTNNRGAIAANATAITALTTNDLMAAALNAEALIHGTVTTTNSSGLVTAAPVIWPDTATGTLTQTANATRPSLADSYVVTHILSGVTKTYTQPTVTRDSNGFITVSPAIVIT